MPTQAKIDQVSELQEKLEKCSIAVTTTYTNISVNEMTELRRQTRAAGLEFLVVKNTLMSLAADAAQLPQIKDIMQGPTAVAFGYDEPVDVAKVLHEYIRTTRSALTIQGAVMGGGPALDTNEVERLSTLPSKPQLIAQLLGQMQAPIYGLLRVLNGPISKFGYLLQARISQLEAEGPAAVAEPAPAAEEAPVAVAEAEPAVAEEVTAEAEAEPVVAEEESPATAEAEPVEAEDPAGESEKETGDPE